MTEQFELSEKEVEDLIVVLNENEEAVGETDAVRWTEESASQISHIRQKITEQAQAN